MNQSRRADRSVRDISFKSFAPTVGACRDLHDILIKEPDFTFNPSCKKRIKIYTWIEDKRTDKHTTQTH